MLLAPIDENNNAELLLRCEPNIGRGVLQPTVLVDNAEGPARNTALVTSNRSRQVRLLVGVRKRFAALASRARYCKVRFSQWI